MSVTDLHPRDTNLPFYPERVDLAAAFRWTARLNMHEGVSNHFSLSVNEDGTKFLMNPNQVHFSRVKASDLLLIGFFSSAIDASNNCSPPSEFAMYTESFRPGAESAQR